ncbi:hypothetical protein DMC47_27075 [Nostoc sp. 3335mG]|nr:hypothetical protein DMC47_27075 [Nostoc sp. 3335mG]
MAAKKSLSVTEIDRRLTNFDSILIPHPRLSDTHVRLSLLVAQTRSRITQHDQKLELAKGRPIKSAELWVQPIVGPSGSGKSRALSTYVDDVYSSEETNETAIPVLIVTMRSSTRTPRQLQSQILEAYKDPSASTVLTERDYSEAMVNEAIRKIARHRETNLVIIDEASNALKGTHNQLSMAKAIKSLVNDGLFSIVLAGTSAVNSLINCDPELMSRTKERIDFGRLRQNQPDLRYFMDFVRDLENRMIQLQVMDNPIGLATDIGACGAAYDMSEGVIGIVVRIFRIALERAFMSGKTSLDWETIALAFRAWKDTDDGLAKRYDPFVAGVKPDTIKIIEAIARKAAA